MNYSMLFLGKIAAAAAWPLILIIVQAMCSAHLLKALGPRWSPLGSHGRHHFLFLLKQFWQRPGPAAWRPAWRVRIIFVLFWVLAFWPWPLLVCSPSDLPSQTALFGGDNALVIVVLMLMAGLCLFLLRPHLPSLLGRQSILRLLYHMMAADLPLLFCLLAIYAAHQSFDLGVITQAQEVHWPSPLWQWNLWQQPLGALAFLGIVAIKMNLAPFNQIFSFAELGTGPWQDLGLSKFYFLRLAYQAHLLLWPVLFCFFYLGGRSLLPGLDLWEVGPQGTWFLENLSLFIKVVGLLYALHWANYLFPSLKNEDVVGWGIKYLMPAALLNWFWVLAQGWMN